MKAIIRVGQRDSIFDAVRTTLATGGSDDFQLTFESAKSLFSELTPARIDLLKTLRKQGCCSVYALAKAADRNYSNVHTDVNRLLDLGLVERTDDDLIFAPYDDLDININLDELAKAA